MYELAQSVVEILRERADERQISIDITGEQPLMTANRQMIDELLYNLIDNAIKYNYVHITSFGRFSPSQLKGTSVNEQTS